MENSNNKSLSGKFPAVSTGDWETKIREDLKGADYEKKLVWETHDGFRVRPYYRREDLGGIGYLQSEAGRFPYLRGAGTDDNSWLVRQDILVQDAATANAYAKELIIRGVDSIGFDLTGAAEISEKMLHGLLGELPLEELHVNLILDGQMLNVLKWVHSYADANGIDAARVQGSISFDPMGKLGQTGNYRESLEADLGILISCLEFAADRLPAFRVLQVGGNIFHDAGASASQALAFTLALGNEYLVRLSEKNIPFDRLLPHMLFRFSTGPSYFLEIAKLRAARFLWSRILEAHSADMEDMQAMFIHSQTSQWNQTMYDPHVNMLRGTSESMSAIIGGTDSLTVTPFDAPLQDPGEFSDRVARNSQIILKEESYMDKVIDPGAGSYYIESLTDQLITTAWELFLESEDKGGFIGSLTEGFIQDEIARTAGARLKSFATRREMLLGTNQFPIFDESLADADPEAGVRGSEAGRRDAGADTILTPLTPFRGAQEFEQLRLRTDRHKGKRPVVFIIPLGNLAMRRARAMFTQNFFACAGFRVIDNIGKFSTVVEGLIAARESGADIVVLCSSDDEYPGMAEEFAKGAGKEMVPVIAGYPKDHMDSLKAAGISHYIHVKSNLLEELKNYQELLGIAGKPVK